MTRDGSNNGVYQELILYLMPYCALLALRGNKHAFMTSRYGTMCVWRRLDPSRSVIRYRVGWTIPAHGSTLGGLSHVWTGISCLNHETVIGYVTMAAINEVNMLLPYIQVKSLRLTWWSVWNLRVPDLQMSCRLVYMTGYQGAVSIWRCRLTSIGIPVIKIRWSRDRLIFNMGIPILLSTLTAVASDLFNYALRLDNELSARPPRGRHGLWTGLKTQMGCLQIVLTICSFCFSGTDHSKFYSDM